MDDKNRKSKTLIEHLEINMEMLAAGLTQNTVSREGAKPRSSDERRTFLATSLLISALTDDT
jgi:hypothetical protein